ncbi:MAG: cobalt ECF transporter T component CbiQ [Planctomycetaceae bacterium]
MADRTENSKSLARSLCHQLPSPVKVLMVTGIILLAAVIPAAHWPVHGVLLTLVFIAHSLARIPLRTLFRRLLVFLPIVVLLSLSFPLSQGFESGWPMMWAILLRSTLAFLAVLWLVNVMPIDELLVTLRRLRVPAVFVATLSFMYRYLFLLWEEMETMRLAREARSFGRASLPARWRTSVHLIGMLLIRSMERAERVHSAMCARGWDGHIRRLPERRDERVESS